VQFNSRPIGNSKKILGGMNLKQCQFVHQTQVKFSVCSQVLNVMFICMINVYTI
jgi:hypothetical protein